MSRCLTKFHISGLGEPYLYQNLGYFTRMWGFLLGGCLTVKNWWGLLILLALLPLIYYTFP